MEFNLDDVLQQQRGYDPILEERGCELAESDSIENLAKGLPVIDHKQERPK